MANVPDSITLAELIEKAAQALCRAGLDRRIDIYREVEIDDPAVRLMLGRSHRVRVRVKITATSLLFENNADVAETALERPSELSTPLNTLVGSSDPFDSSQS